MPKMTSVHDQLKPLCPLSIEGEITNNKPINRNNTNLIYITNIPAKPVHRCPKPNAKHCISLYHVTDLFLYPLET